MTIDWTHAWSTMLAAFLASAVECVEALTVVLAVGTVRGWRGAIAGSVGALACLLVIVAALGPALTLIPLGSIQLVVGGLLLLFGLRWLRKAVLRAAGVIPLHDEAAAYAKKSEALRRHAPHAGGWDPVALGTAFKITMLEGLEVVFIVVAVGAGGTGLLVPASLGALAALILVVAIGFLLHRPLASIPENTLKFGVGVLLAGFGTFWVGEGMGIAWPGADWSIPALCLGFLAVALAAVPVCRRPAPLDAPARQVPAMSILKTVLSEVLGLFVDDGSYAVAILVWLCLCDVVLPRWPALGPWAGAVLFAGLAIILVDSARRRARR